MADFAEHPKLKLRPPGNHRVNCHRSYTAIARCADALRLDDIELATSQAQKAVGQKKESAFADVKVLADAHRVHEQYVSLR
jgi:hypothetical protein